MAVKPDPLGGIEKGLTGKGPALEIELFLFVAIALQHHVTLFTDSLDLAERGFQFENPKVVETAKRDNKVEVIVAKGIGVLRAIAEE
jgi:hypothetical protein